MRGAVPTAGGVFISERKSREPSDQQAAHDRNGVTFMERLARSDYFCKRVATEFLETVSHEPQLGDAGERFFNQDLNRMTSEELKAERKRLRLRLLIDVRRHPPMGWWFLQRAGIIEQLLIGRP